ncbi:hypothetical protein ABXN37_04690 [Piscinibacter sakaiensis]|uniref:Uncharacterized protein n=1 Tax=Piscinibacter sakaiensis TaxID=1547922 RepID=A0A0K8NWY1_PISS1|nr:hypothetical protein [Piscinibacter sakaiensis]GAP34445.1 hypothetical protein ISF6_4620 [Piscinibacter sakaiensis]
MRRPPSSRLSREPEVDPFYDMLFNMLIAFVFCFIVALLAMNPKALKAGDIPSKAEYIINVSWPDNDPNDIDTWVEDPGGNLVWYRAREAGLMHLDRDDRGLSNDTIVLNGKQIVNPLNQEVVTVRGIQPGEFTVNLQYYDTKNGQAVQATVSVIKVNPRADVVFYGQLDLARKGDEATAVRFTVLPDGQVTNVNTLPKKLVQRP